MNTKQAIQQLKAMGADFKQGKKHTKVYLNGKQSVIPRHREIPDQLFQVIKKQLGID
jgi:mRNA interferase HicA